MSKPLHLIAMLLLCAAPVAAQEPQVPADTTLPAPGEPMVPDQPGVETPPTPGPSDTTLATPDTPAPSPADTTPPEAVRGGAAHDWEFALAPTDRAPGASGNVMVTEGDPRNAFVVMVSGLPDVDSLDQEGRDVEEYSVWIVPSKDRVQEAALAGTIEIDTGGGRFEGSTDLDTFGVIILASSEGVTSPSGVPVLTGIPVTQAEAAAETPAETPAPTVPSETPAETPMPEAPAGEPVPQAPEPNVPEPAPAPPDTTAPDAP